MRLGDGRVDGVSIGDVEREAKHARRRTSATSGSSVFASRAVATTLSPRSSAASAHMRPNPFDVPVMNQVFMGDRLLCRAYSKPALFVDPPIGICCRASRESMGRASVRLLRVRGTLYRDGMSEQAGRPACTEGAGRSSCRGRPRLTDGRLGERWRGFT